MCVVPLNTFPPSKPNLINSKIFKIDDKEKLGGKLSDDDKKTIETSVDQVISWLDANREATVEELEERKKDFEAKVQPIITKLYAAGGGPPPPGYDGGAGGPPPSGGEEKDEL